MAIRVRQNGDMFCAALSDEAEGDTYIDDETHYQLSAIKKLLVAEPCPEHELSGGRWFWCGSIPDGVNIDPFYSQA